ELLMQNASALHSGKPAQSSDELIGALRSVLDEKTLEPAFVALALTPPSEADLAREIGKDVDTDAIFNARSALRAAIGGALAQQLVQTYQSMTVPGSYSPKAVDAGRRSLRNAALDLLAAGDAKTGVARAAAQYNAADNMTDRFAALATLSLYDTAER